MRLIDADKLIDYFYFGIDDKPIIDGISDRKIIDIINNQPTAYSVDKVVEELEEAKGNVPVNRFLDDIIKEKPKELGQLIAYERAIEIVKQSGVSDDVCEWELTDTRKMMPYKTSCGNEDLYDNSYKYCPYCGKKRKVGD